MPPQEKIINTNIKVDIMRYFKITGYRKQFGIFDKRIAEILDKKYLKNKTVLEIGCGYGNLLQAFQELGYRVIGIDIDNDAEKICKEKKLEFHKCDVDKDKLPFYNNSIESIICIHLMEHLRNVPRFLEECYRILKKSGIIVIISPNWEKFYKNYWDDPTHVTPVSKRGMKNMLIAHNFDIVDIKPFKKPDYVKWIWRYFDFPFFMSSKFMLWVGRK